MDRGRRGRDGERAAERWLRRRGWRIVVRNWRGGGGELDIVAARRGVVAVCEVKTRHDADALADPLTAAQRRRIVQAAAALLARRPDLAGHEVRFDLIAVRPAVVGWRIRRVPGAFEARAEWRRYGSNRVCWAGSPYAAELKDIL